MQVNVLLVLDLMIISLFQWMDSNKMIVIITFLFVVQDTVTPKEVIITSLVVVNEYITLKEVIITSLVVLQDSKAPLEIGITS